MEVGIRELRRNLSAILDIVVEGEEVIVLRNGKPVARLVPPSGETPRLPSLAEFRKGVDLKGRTMSAEIIDERRAGR